MQVDRFEGAHIVFLALDAYSKVGGLQNFNRRIVSALKALNRDATATQVSVYLKDDHQGDIPVGEETKIIAFGGNKAKFIATSIGDARKVDVVLVGHINLLPLAALYKVFNWKAKIALFVHGVDVWNLPAFRPKRIFEPLLLKLVDTVCSVSEFTARIMQAEFSVPGNRFYLLPNAVDYCEAREHRSDNEHRSILSVSRLDLHDRAKNIDKVIRAIASLRKDGIEVVYEIVGEGPLRPELEARAAALGVDDLVRFLGRVDDAGLLAAYNRSIAFVLPSAKEGFGIVFLEAWLQSLPVICGTEDAVHELVEHGVDGFAINPKSGEDLARCVRWLIENPDRAKEMGRRGYEKVTRFYLMSNFEKNLANMIERLISGHKPLSSIP